MTLSTAADPPGQLGHVVRAWRPDDAGGHRPPAPHRSVARAQLNALTGVVEDLAGQFELRPLLDRILRHAAGLLNCQSGSICTVDEPAGTYRKEVDLGVHCRSGDEFPLTEGVTGEILRAGGPVTFAEYAHVRGGHIEPTERADLHATIGVPIRWAGAVIGACIVFSREPQRRFEAADVTLLELFAGHAGLAIVNARMHARAAELARAEATGLERERVVRDVHDSVARALASVVLHLSNADPPTPGGPAAGPDPDAQRDHLGLARQAARTALDETRRTVMGVRPTQAGLATLEHAIESQVDRARSTGLDIRLVVAGPPRAVPFEVMDELSVLAQQAIANIVAHADARTARVGLVYGTAELVLLIQDDGVGFDVAQLPRPDGSRAGLSGPGLPEITEIAHRAEHLGGAVQIDATPGWGTTIRAAVPYRPAPPGPAPRSSVLVVEHRPMVRAGLLAALAEAGDAIAVVGEISGADEVLDAYRLLQPDVVLLDGALPGGATAMIGQLRGLDHDAAVVAIGDTAAGEAPLRAMVQAGARAVVMIEADGSVLARAIGAAARGDALFTDEVLHGLYDAGAPSADIALTPRERQVRDLVSEGLPDKQIADRLTISVKTVEKHVGSALRKTGAHNRTELAGMAHRSGRRRNDLAADERMGDR